MVEMDEGTEITSASYEERWRNCVIAFDMDGTLLTGRLVFALADACNVRDLVKGIMYNRSMHGYEKSLAIARLWRGLHRDDLVRALKGIPLSPNARETVHTLKEYGYTVGIISDSYDIVVGHLASMLGMDFSVANRVVYDASGTLTGEIEVPLGWERVNCTCMNSVCKRFHLRSIAERYGVEYTVSVGDSDNDICMLEEACVSIAYRPKSARVIEKAMYVIDDLYDTVTILGRETLRSRW